ncbi:DUF1579 domain-containing protein [Flavobacterium sp. MAH-1]|uniref:DUF1579 domain-containing protein n=1 Tax=Flavobacterium agri TaxID=2743471 RepID=A0A7Y9C7Q7_9FLAO|nr:DUF1579 domain-containing protein [Flavobacterium agri]NUY81573.1 DUF1579 domain-containing protein [Flavobacterium agri]NYA71597.1 DUF1579 domain-containing protein [Flavobacterium agri]
MKKLLLCAAVLALTVTGCKKAEDKAVETGSADTVKVEAPAAETAETAAPPSKEEMEKAWGEYMTPGEMHKLLASDVGSWKANMTMYMDPTNPTKAESTADIKMVMGGRYQEAHYKGKIDGMDFEGVASVGFNNASKKFESTWMDNMGTGVMYTTGEYDPASKSITFKGSSVDPMTKKEKGFREVYTFVDDNTRKMEMFDSDPTGKEYKSMEIELKRK